MKDRTLKNQKKHINKTLKQFRLAKRLIQLSITGTVSVITASLSVVVKLFCNTCG